MPISCGRWSRHTGTGPGCGTHKGVGTRIGKRCKRDSEGTASWSTAAGSTNHGEIVERGNGNVKSKRR